MSLRLRPFLAPLAALALVAAHPGDARACGGCFHEASQTESTVVTGHRMAFSLSPARTILWDQIQYAGAPASFAWVLPVKAGAEVQLSTDAWFEALDAATGVQVVSPPVDCVSASSGGSNGCSLGCGAANEAGVGDYHDLPTRPDVTVTHQGTVGPYETVTLHTSVPGALNDWLTAHGFAVDAGVQPVIDAYVAEGFDFIALRLQPGQGIQQMKPVRVVTPGMSPTLPLRMVAAGTGATVGITLFVLGEGRWQAQNFPNGEVAPADVSWDFLAEKSNYGTLRTALLGTNAGRTWSTSYAKKGALLQNVTDGIGTPITYSVGSQGAGTIAAAYAVQGQLNGETQDVSCLDVFANAGAATAVVNGACLGQGSGGGGGGGGAGTGGAGTGGGGTGGAPGGCTLPPTDLDARSLACGALDDVAAALVGMHPADVWVTRLEASLPRAALAQDMNLEAGSQAFVENWFYPAKTTNDPCATALNAEVFTRPAQAQARADVQRKNRLALGGAVLLAVAAAVGRRRRRAPLAGAASR